MPLQLVGSLNADLPNEESYKYSFPKIDWLPASLNDTPNVYTPIRLDIYLKQVCGDVPSCEAVLTR